jgi:hypothetical protein
MNVMNTRKVCLSSLPGGSWERPCEGPPRSTEATPPLPRHTHEARPKTAPLAHRQERIGDPKPHWSRTGATDAARRDCARMGRGSAPPSSEAPGSDASAISASAVTGVSTARTATASAATGASASNTSGGPEATAVPAASPSTTTASTEESASRARPTATGAT